ncbi:hypothetical protein MMC24_002676 [Lignoscripta atroalba]|nr:hypothetical protein [Lignoscripta atroalba]
MNEPNPSTPSVQEGPSHAPPSLPDGWLAQWEGQSRKYYYVQRATGHSQWDVPNQPALSVPTPDSTPQPRTDPFEQPSATRGQDQVGGSYQGADRGLLGDLMGKKPGNKPQSSSGLGGIASSLLGGGSHGGGSHGGGSHGGGGIAGQLVGSLLGGGKPQNQQHTSQPSSGSGGFGGFGGSSSGTQQHGGLMNMASGLLGGHHGSSSQNNYGYSSGGQGAGSGGYSGQAPPAAYKPPGQQSNNQYGTQNPSQTQPQQSYQGGQYQAPGQQQHQQAFPNTPHGPQLGQGEQRPQGNYGQPSHSYATPPPGQYGGSNPAPPNYGQQNPAYQPQASASPYNPYPQQGHQPPGQQGPYEMYAAAQPTGSHPGQPGPGQHGAPAGGYPGQQGYGAQDHQRYGQQPPQQGAYGQQGSQYNSYGAPPAPGWRA